VVRVDGADMYCTSTPLYADMVHRYTGARPVSHYTHADRTSAIASQQRLIQSDSLFCSRKSCRTSKWR